MTTGVTIDFNANLARFTGAIDKATNDLNKFQSNAQRISGNIKSAFGALGVGVGVGAFTALIKGSIDAQDHLLDLAKTTRLSVEDLAGLSSAAKKSGSDLDATAKAINKLAVEMGKNPEKFAALGITAKNQIEAFGQVADVMKSIEDPQRRAAFAAEALGKSWQGSAPLMEEGSAGMQKLIDRGKELSKVTTESAQAADEFNDRWEDLKTRADGWSTKIFNPLVKGALDLADALATAELAGGPGSIFDLLFGKGPQKKQLGASGSWDLPTPPNAAIDKFIGGEKTAKISKTANDLQRVIELGQRNQFELLDSEEEQRILATTRAMRDATEEFQALQRIIKVGEENELAAYYETAGEETMRLVAEQRTLQDAVKESDNFARDLGLTFTSAFEEAIVGGENLSDVIKGLWHDVQRIVLRKTVTEPLGNWVSDFVKNAFGGGRAAGGSVSSNKWYVVGENGPEIFAPGTSGTVLPNARGGGGLVVNIIEDSGRAGQVSQRQAGSGVNMLDVFVDRVRAAVAGDIARGSGPIPQALGATYGLNRAAGAY